MDRQSGELNTPSHQLPLIVCDASLTALSGRLDAFVMESTTRWAALIQRTRHITDFTNWKQHDDYQKALTRLVRDRQLDTPLKKV